MNEITPGRLQGSLLERAAARFALSPQGSPTSFAPAPIRDLPPRQPAQPVDRAMLAARGMIVPGAPVTALAEEFRLVKRQLLLTARAVAGQDRARSRAILVCSAQPDDGKTFCAVNLAMSLAAEKDVEVLLVDADFAKADVARVLGLSTEGEGLLDALADPAIDAEALVIQTDIPGLSILPAGTRTHVDTELLASDHARAVIERLAAVPRRILLFDSPPILAASPASVLAGYVGQVMLVVRADRTGETDLREAVALLDGCDHVQLLLNAVAFRPGGTRYGSYYGQEPLT